MQRIRLWIYAARPKTLTVGLAPILIGTSLAASCGKFHLSVFLFTLLGALSIQIGTNYCNDYFDFIKGADTKERKGFQKVLSAGYTTHSSMKAAYLICFIFSLFSSIYLGIRGGFPVFLIGCICIVLSYFYTAGPKPLAYLGLGDIFVFIFYGPVAALTTYYLQTLEVNLGVFIASLAPGFIGVAVLTVNNIRDIQEDQKVFKKNSSS